MWAKMSLVAIVAILTLAPPPPAAQANFNGVLTPSASVNKLKYLGCANELSNGPRALSSAATASVTHMTVESCAAFCAGKGYAHSGVEYAQECYCGNALRQGSKANLPGAQCNMACKGNSKQFCGGPSRISVFENSAYVKTSNPDRIGPWAYQTCYMEPDEGRALPDKLIGDDAMTVEKCLAYCDSQGLCWAGLEYCRECWCARTLIKGHEDASDPGCAMQCDMPCGGNNKQFCGGAGAINVYKKDGATMKPAAAPAALPLAEPEAAKPGIKPGVEPGVVEPGVEEPPGDVAEVGVDEPPVHEKRHEGHDHDEEAVAEQQQEVEEQRREEKREAIPPEPVPVQVQQQRATPKRQKWSARFGRMRRGPAKMPVGAAAQA